MPLPQLPPQVPSVIPSLPSLPPLDSLISASHLRELAMIALVLVYIFAAGKIADFLQSSGKKISKQEVLLVPFAYLFVAAAGAFIYFGSGAGVPPQNTIITIGAYLLAIPLGICIGLGAIVLHAFFRDRLSPLQSLDLSMKVMLAPIFDGLKGYWTAFGAAAILVFISGFTYWSSGGNFALVTLDFLLLSSVASLFFLYRAITATGNENKASNLVTLLTLLAPSVLRLYFKDLACAVLSLIPLDFFKACPLLQVGNEVTLALSVLATLVIVIPVIPVIYALIVNLLRFLTVVEVLLAREQKVQPQEHG